MLDEYAFWKAVAAYVTDPDTTKRLGLDTVYQAEIDRGGAGKACWCKRASRTLTYRMHDIARERGLEEKLFGWFVAIVPGPKWPTDTTINLLVIDHHRKHWGLHELMGEPAVEAVLDGMVAQ